MTETRTPAVDAIRARRRLTNKLIAAHDAARLRPFFDPEVKLVAGDGALIVGVAQLVDAFAAQFREPGFVAYERITETVDLDQEEARAAESGRWVGTWRDQTLSGRYFAVWKKAVGQWVIESELYLSLAWRSNSTLGDPL